MTPRIDRTASFCPSYTFTYRLSCAFLRQSSSRVAPHCEMISSRITSPLSRFRLMQAYKKAFRQSIPQSSGWPVATTKPSLSRKAEASYPEVTTQGSRQAIRPGLTAYSPVPAHAIMVSEIALKQVFCAKAGVPNYHSRRGDRALKTPAGLRRHTSLPVSVCGVCAGNKGEGMMTE